MPPSDLALRRAALRAALAVSTLSGAAAAGCTTDAPPDEIFVAVDASADTRDGATDGDTGADTAADTGADTGAEMTGDTTAPPDVTVLCGSEDRICPSGCDTCADVDCCREAGGDWYVETLGTCSECFAEFCLDDACCAEIGCGHFAGSVTYGYCAAGGCAVPGPFRPPAVRV